MDGRDPVGDLLEGGTGPPWWRRAWTELPAAGRRALVAVLLVALAGGAVLWLRHLAAEQERRERVDLATSLGVVSSSTEPPGGRVRFFVLVRNDGPLPVSVTAVDGGGQGLRVQMLADGERTVGPGREIEIPLSVRLTCPASAGELAADLRVRRQDGGSTTRRTTLKPAQPVTDVAVTLCAVRPGLRDHELAGPVLRGP